jgi:hypothetical protein
MVWWHRCSADDNEVDKVWLWQGDGVIMANTTVEPSRLGWRGRDGEAGKAETTTRPEHG